MAFEKNPDELGMISIKPWKDKEYWDGKVFPIPEGVPVVFESFTYIAKYGPLVGQEVKAYRVLLYTPEPPEDEQKPPF